MRVSQNRGELRESADVVPVKVRFPGGVEREVPSALRAISTGSGSSLVEVPNESVEWRFIPLSGDLWLASPKKKH